MDKMKHFIECTIPIEACNLRCPYCYVSQHDKLGKNNYENLCITKEHDLSEFRRAFHSERWGGLCLINLCANGETLLYKDIVLVIKALLEEGHYVSIVTNGTLTTKFEEISKLPEALKKHLFIKFSR